MQCPRCLSNIQYDWNFCPKCNNPINQGYKIFNAIGNKNNIQGQNIAIGSDGNINQTSINIDKVTIPKYIHRAEDYINRLTSVLNNTADETVLMTKKFIEYTDESKSGGDKSRIRALMAQHIQTYGVAIKQLSKEIDDCFPLFNQLMYDDVRSDPNYYDQNIIKLLANSIDILPYKIEETKKALRNFSESLQSAMYYYNRLRLDSSAFSTCIGEINQLISNIEHSKSCLTRLSDKLQLLV